MNKEVLLVDDDPIFHLIFKRMIKKVDKELRTKTFLNAKDALDFLENSYRIDKQYLILLDINMPTYNGWYFIDGIEKDGIADNNNITLYIVTSSTDESDIKYAQSYSCIKGVLSKPLSINSIQDILEDTKM